VGVTDTRVKDEVGWGVFVGFSVAWRTGVGVFEESNVAVTVASVVALICVGSLTGVGVMTSNVAPMQPDRSQLRRASKFKQ